MGFCKTHCLCQRKTFGSRPIGSGEAVGAHESADVALGALGSRRALPQSDVFEVIMLVHAGVRMSL